MKAEITSIQKRLSKHGGEVSLVTFKSEDGNSYVTWLDPKNRNWKKWDGVLEIGNNLDGLKVKKGNLIDADSTPK